MRMACERGDLDTVTTLLVNDLTNVEQHRTTNQGDLGHPIFFEFEVLVSANPWLFRTTCHESASAHASKGHRVKRR